MVALNDVRNSSLSYLLNKDGTFIGSRGTGAQILPPSNDPNATAEAFAKQAFGGKTPTELPRVYRRAICSVIRQRYQVCSDLHRRRVRLRREACRFIPACAGNTWRRWERWHRKPVHPRVCGEHGYLGEEQIYRTGSSPRVRGTRSVSQCSPHGFRFIPACAGNTKTKTCCAL